MKPMCDGILLCVDCVHTVIWLQGYPCTLGKGYRVWYLLSDTESSQPPDESAHVQHEFVARTILRQIIAKLEESASSFPGERA